MWKSRFRFLLCSLQGANHKLMSKLIYASCTLHNYLVVHRDDRVEIDTSDACWQEFFTTFKKMSCPACTRSKIAHCPHQAAYRNGNAVQGRRRPSLMRDEECARLWAEVCGESGEGAALARRAMEERAALGFREE